MKLCLLVAVSLGLVIPLLSPTSGFAQSGYFTVYYDKHFTTQPKELESVLVAFEIPFEPGTVGCELQFWRDGELRRFSKLTEPRRRFMQFVWRTPPQARTGKWQLRVVCSESSELWSATFKTSLKVKKGTTEGYSIAKSIRARHLKLCTPKQQKKVEKQKKGLLPCVLAS